MNYTEKIFCTICVGKGTFKSSVFLFSYFNFFLPSFVTWEKKVEITEQKDRRFKGTFSYTDGTKNFFGVIHPDNITITWVASNSRGYNIGKLLDKNNISACYVEAGIDATAGCADLKRK